MASDKKDTPSPNPTTLKEQQANFPSSLEDDTKSILNKILEQQNKIIQRQNEMEKKIECILVKQLFDDRDLSRFKSLSDASWMTYVRSFLDKLIILQGLGRKMFKEE